MIWLDFCPCKQLLMHSPGIWCHISIKIVRDNRMFIMTVTGNSSPNNRELEVPNMPTSSVCDGIMTTRTTNILRQATRPAAMDFSGTWKVYSEENLEDFLKEIGRNVFYLFRDYFPMYAYIMIFIFF